MRIHKILFPIVFACCLAFVSGCNRSAPPVSASERQKITEQQRQAAIDKQVSQVNSSNLAPEEKQRIINQVRASGGQ